MLRAVKIIFLVLLAIDIYAQEPATVSVLSTGKWFKIAVTEDGVYKIDFAKLKQLGLDNPAKPKIYGANYGQLSYYNNAPKPDDLKEMAIYISGNDDELNEGEYILFFGKGVNRWDYDDTANDYNHIRHNYSDTAYYFITSGNLSGKRITVADSALTVNYLSETSDALFIHEVDNVNLISSGREWFQPVSSIGGLTINPGFQNLITSEKIHYKIRVAARAGGATMFSLSENKQPVKEITVQPVNLFNHTGTYANIVEYSDSLTAAASPAFELKYITNGALGENAGWLDYLILQGRKQNIFNGAAYLFSDKRSVGNGRATEYKLSGVKTDVTIWNVTDIWNVNQMPFKKTGETISFKDSSATLNTYFAFSSASILTPVISSVPTPNQNLRASPPADMIIVSHPKFLKYAEQLKEIHAQTDGIISIIVTPEQIYNEFSGGIPDIAAIRNFVRFRYLNQKDSAKPLKYLLLFGKGSYDNKTKPPYNPNFIPTYQSQNSNVRISSFTSDDFYGLLDNDEGEANGSLDIGIGRLPVVDTVEAGVIISKIRNYLNPKNNGNWKNIICLTADDGDGNTHISDSEILAKYLNDSVPVYNVDKIYLDAYKKVTSAGGQSYPDVNKKINDRINSGCLIFNYVGHGNENGLAHESVLTIGDIRSWKNESRLPLFVTATCEFSRFDDIDINTLTGVKTAKTSAGELTLLKEKTGSIALMSTTRVVFSTPNALLNQNILRYAFKRDANDAPLAFGDIIRLAKNNAGNDANNRNFILLGDPALKLQYPWHGNIVTDEINGIPISAGIDTLKALSLVTISGHIEDIYGNLASDFNGIVSPTIFDKETNAKTLANDGGAVVEFPVRNNILFNGKTKANNGKFSFSFIVPRDIDYTIGYGKISYYASDEASNMQGYFNDIIVGGFSQQLTNDTEGPEIELYLNDVFFKNGGITDASPKLLAIIKDKSGINTTGLGIGHDLIAYLDKKPNDYFILNNYFETEFDDYTRGTVVYNLSNLSEGEHTLTLKAWDNYNNSSTASIRFFVETDGKFILKNLLNYPNPFTDETSVRAEHNRPDTELDVIIRIISLNGKIVKTITSKTQSSGFSIPPIIWDGKDDGGAKVAKGLYPYTVTIKTPNGETAIISGRMIIL